MEKELTTIEEVPRAVTQHGLIMDFIDENSSPYTDDMTNAELSAAVEYANNVAPLILNK